MRRYTVTVEIECWDQDDLKHFQPDTVNARIVDTDITVVGNVDRGAIRMMFDFLLSGAFRGEGHKSIPLKIQEATDGETGRDETPLP